MLASLGGTTPIALVHFHNYSADLESRTVMPMDARASGRRKRQREVLTKRQREVLTKAAQGHSEKETARALGISESTVGAHLQSAFARLDARCIANAVAIAILLGLILSDSTDFPQLPT